MAVNSVKKACEYNSQIIIAFKGCECFKEVNGWMTSI